MKYSSGRLLMTTLIGAILSYGAGVLAEEQNVRDNIFRISDWDGYDQVSVLRDGTSLYSYIAESRSLSVKKIPESKSNGESMAAGFGINQRIEHNSLFRFTFIPRFQCAPLVEILGRVHPDTPSAKRIVALRNFNQLSLEIDGEQFDFPAVVEEDSHWIRSFFSASLQRRTTLRILIELADLVVVTFGDRTKTSFLLNGSQGAISQALGRCRNHQ